MALPNISQLGFVSCKSRIPTIKLFADGRREERHWDTVPCIWISIMWDEKFIPSSRMCKVGAGNGPSEFNKPRIYLSQLLTKYLLTLEIRGRRLALVSH